MYVYMCSSQASNDNTAPNIDVDLVMNAVFHLWNAMWIFLQLEFVIVGTRNNGTLYSGTCTLGLVNGNLQRHAQTRDLKL